MLALKINESVIVSIIIELHSDVGGRQTYLASYVRAFLGGSAGKESTCNAGDPGSIPGLGRSTGEGIGYPFQSSWASLVAQLVKNPPAVRVTWVRLLGWEDPLEKGKAAHSSTLA